MVFAETLAILGLFVATLVGFVNRGEDPLLAALSIVIVVAVVALWLVLTLTALLRNRGWARGSTLTIQILAFSVAVGAFQGIYAQVGIGWTIAIPAMVTFVAALIARAPATRVAEPGPDAEAAN